MLKKTLGFVLFAIGLLLENIGIFGMGNSGGKLHSLDGQVGSVLYESYRAEHDKSLLIGGALMTIGLILIVVGIVLIATKTQTQKEKEMELRILKSKEV